MASIHKRGNSFEVRYRDPKDGTNRSRAFQSQALRCKISFQPVTFYAGLDQAQLDDLARPNDLVGADWVVRVGSRTVARRLQDALGGEFE